MEVTLASIMASSLHVYAMEIWSAMSCCATAAVLLLHHPAQLFKVLYLSRTNFKAQWLAESVSAHSSLGDTRAVTYRDDCFAICTSLQLVMFQPAHQVC